MLFFVTLYMQTVLHLSPVQTGLASYRSPSASWPSGAATQLFARTESRPIVAGGALIAGRSGVLALSGSRCTAPAWPTCWRPCSSCSSGSGVCSSAFRPPPTPACQRTSLAAAWSTPRSRLGSALGLAISPRSRQATPPPARRPRSPSRGAHLGLSPRAARPARSSAGRRADRDAREQIPWRTAHGPVLQDSSRGRHSLTTHDAPGEATAPASRRAAMLLNSESAPTVESARSRAQAAAQSNVPVRRAVKRAGATAYGSGGEYEYLLDVDALGRQASPRSRRGTPRARRPPRVYCNPDLLISRGPR